METIPVVSWGSVVVFVAGWFVVGGVVNEVAGLVWDAFIWVIGG